MVLDTIRLQSEARKWSPSLIGIKNSRKFTSSLLPEEIGMKIDQPSSDGGNASTGNIARMCFLDKPQFLYWVSRDPDVFLLLD